VSKSILVVGGAGYIGSHAVLGLKQRGYQPIVYDNLSTGHKEAVSGPQLIIGNLSDQEKLKNVFKKHSINAVMHFAASSLVGESMKDPLKYYANNVSNAIGLLEMMKSFGVKVIIFSSTAAVYGNPKEIPIKEESPLKPINPYGRSKLMIENILHDCSLVYGMRYVSLRYFNAAGADEKGRIGEAHKTETHLIPLVLQAASQQREKINIFGTDYETEDGTCIRDYIHVTDLIEAHVLALEYLFDRGQSDIFNLGNEQGYSVREIITVAQEVCQKKIPIEESKRRVGDPSVLIASAQKIKDTLHWQAKCSDIQNIIKTAWQWACYYQKNPWSKN